VQFANDSYGGRTSEDAVEIAGAAALEHTPDLAVIAFGINDQKATRRRRFSLPRTISPEEYGANIAEAARLIRFRCGADVVLVAPCRLPVARESGRYRDVLQRLAAEHGYGFADPLEFWHDGSELIAQDGVHPNANGHRLYAEALIAHVDL
jgi:lysophospholipase L1-like esterase